MGARVIRSARMRRNALIVLAVVGGVVAGLLALRARRPGADMKPEVVRAHVYPLVVAPNDVPPGAALHRPLGFAGLEVALVLEVPQAHGPALLVGLSPSDLAAAGVTPDEGWKLAVANLASAAAHQQIPMQVLHDAKGTAQFVIFGRDWRGASCLLLPGLRELAAKALGTPDVAGLLPHREVLALFPDKGPEERRKTVDFLLEKEKGGRWRLSDAPVRLLPVGQAPFYAAPVAAAEP